MDSKSFVLSHEDAQDKDNWSRVPPFNPGLTVKWQLVKAVSACEYIRINTASVFFELSL